MQQDAPSNVSAPCCFLYRVFRPHSLPHDFFQQSLVAVHHTINYTIPVQIQDTVVVQTVDLDAYDAFLYEKAGAVV